MVCTAFSLVGKVMEYGWLMGAVFADSIEQLRDAKPLTVRFQLCYFQKYLRSKLDTYFSCIPEQAKH